MGANLGDLLTFILGFFGAFYILYRILEAHLLRKVKPVPKPDENTVPDCSYATEHVGTTDAEHVPILLGTLTDDQLLDILARVQFDGDYRFAESKIGRFIGGRLEDRILQVRQIRDGKRQIIINGVRSIPIEED